MTPAPDDAGADARLARVASIFRAAPFVQALGITLEEAGPGRCRTRLALRPEHLQHTGQAHAGVVTTLADHTAGAAAQTLIDGGGWAITAELKLSLLRPATGTHLECEAMVLKPGRQLVFTEAEVFACGGGERRLVAKLSATMAVVTSHPPAPGP